MGKEYSMGNTILGISVKEKDLGVTFSADITDSVKCGLSAAKGNQILRLKTLIITLYKAIVRLHLEYCIQARRQYHKKDIDKFESVQRRATMLIPELKHLCYERRLLESGLTTLETRRLRGDLMAVLKIFIGYEDVEKN